MNWPLASSPRCRRAAELIFVVVGLAACGESNLPGDVTWESEHFVYKTRAGEAVACQDILQPFEEHFEVLRDTLGLSWPSGRKVTYYKFLNHDDLAQNSECGSGGGGCANGSGVQTAIPFHEHELVHSYLWPVGHPPWLLIEGAAVALGCSRAIYPRPEVSWREVLALPYDSRASAIYGAGAWLVGFLLQTRPASAFLELYGRTPFDASADEFATLFQEIYGESLDDVWDAALSRERPPAMCPWACSRPPAVVDGTTPVPVDLTCGTPNVHTFSLAEPSDLLVTRRGGSYFSLGNCDDVGTFLRRTTVGGDDGTVLGGYVLGAGRYFIEGPYEDVSLTLASRPAGTWIPSTCPAPAAESPWRDLDGILYLSLPHASFQIELSWSMETRVSIHTTNSVTGLAVCPTCSAPLESCSTVLAGRVFDGPIVGSRFIRVLPPAIDLPPGPVDLVVSTFAAPKLATERVDR